MVRIPRITNYTEEIVDRVMKETLAEEDDVCSCSQCLADIATMALNKLPANYYTENREEKSRDSQGQPTTIETMAMVYSAIETVAKSPRHGDNPDLSSDLSTRQYPLTNYTEEMMLKAIKDITDERPNMCRCERCLQDIAALALNEVSPRYVSSDRGKVFTRLDELDHRFYAKCWVVAFDAVKRVEANPHHERGKPNS